MHTVCLPKCSTVGPVARGGGGNIPGILAYRPRATSTSTLTHVWGAYGAPTLCRRRAADGCRELAVDVVWDPHQIQF